MAFRKPKPAKLTDLPDAEWRLALALARDGDARSVPVLLDAMHGYDEGKVAKAEEAIRALGPRAIPELKQAFTQPRKYNPGLVTGLLVDQPTGEVVPFLIDALDKRKTREAATRALAHVRDPRALDALIKAASSGPKRLRGTAVWALGRHGDPRGFETIADALNARDAELRSTAAHALGQLDDPRVFDLLIAALDDREREVRGSAVRALERIGDARAVPALQEVLRREASNPIGNSYTAAKALATLGPAGVDALLAAAEDPDPKVRRNGVVGLNPQPKAALTDDRIVPVLLRNLADDDSQVSNTAASALHNYRDPDTAAAILPHLDDPRAHVRSAAVFAIWIHSDEPVTTKLVRLLRKDPDVGVRRQAAHGLMVGTRPQPYVRDALEDALTDDSDEQVRVKAKASLHRVREAAR
jgi:HEAT repeat protein